MVNEQNREKLTQQAAWGFPGLSPHRGSSSSVVWRNLELSHGLFAHSSVQLATASRQKVDPSMKLYILKI